MRILEILYFLGIYDLCVSCNFVRVFSFFSKIFLERVLNFRRSNMKANGHLYLGFKKKKLSDETYTNK